jgi:hypothetical protein
MIEVVLDEDVFAIKAANLDQTIRTALWGFVDRMRDNPDNPDVIGKERDGFRATQFTSGWVLDWEVTRRRRGWIVDVFSYGKPEEVKLWDLREIHAGSAWGA